MILWQTITESFLVIFDKKTGKCQCLCKTEYSKGFEQEQASVTGATVLSAEINPSYDTLTNYHRNIAWYIGHSILVNVLIKQNILKDLNKNKIQ